MTRTITFKTLDQKTFTVSVQDADSISSVKEKVNALGKPVSKLIYSGKVLDDAKTVAEIDIKEKDFVVVMFAKAKPAPKVIAEASAPTPDAAPAPAATETPASTSTTPAAASSPSEDATMSDATAPTAAASEPAAAAAPAAFNNQASFLSGDALQSAIANMVEMGFEKEQVVKALRASFNNPDRAVEYLMSGIPAELDQPAPAAPSTPSNPTSTLPVTPASAAPSAPETTSAAAPAAASGGEPENLFAAAAAAMQSGPGSGGARGGAPAARAAAPGAPGQLDIAALSQSPMFAQLRQMVQQNPALLQPMIQQLAQANPGLAQQLMANPEALYALLGVAPGDEGDEGEDEWEAGGEDLLAAMGGGGEGGDHNNVIQVTEEERSSIERLESMGFDRNRVLEAYLLCDRNEEMAANYLFDTMNDE